MGAMGAHEALSQWEAFYVIVGSSAGALTGLQFVVMALVADSEVRRSSTTISAFGTPTIVHFCIVLLISALISAPWPRLGGIAIAVGLCGAFGVTYCVIVALRARRDIAYKPVFEDWAWHVVLPFAAYIGLLIAAVYLQRHELPALFTVGASSILLVFVGIHNAWDTVTYVMIDIKEQRADGSAPKRSTDAPE